MPEKCPNAGFMVITMPRTFRVKRAFWNGATCSCPSIWPIFILFKKVESCFLFIHFMGKIKKWINTIGIIFRTVQWYIFFAPGLFLEAASEYCIANWIKQPSWSKRLPRYCVMNIEMLAALVDSPRPLSNLPVYKYSSCKKRNHHFYIYM